jgi:hypothetical protein
VNTADGILLFETQPPGRLWRLRATALCGLRREGQSASDRSVTPLSRNDGRFPLILSERLRKIAIFAAFHFTNSS